MSVTIKEINLGPLLKYPGSKEKELIHILPNIPEKAENYYEPFVGAGSVYFALDCDKSFINDKSSELMEIYRLVKEQDERFFYWLDMINSNWTCLTELCDDDAEILENIYRNYCKDKIKDYEIGDIIIEKVSESTESWRGLFERRSNPCIVHFLQELADSMRSKMVRLREIEAEQGLLLREELMQNLECAVKNAYYMHLRYLYNYKVREHIEPEMVSAIFFFMREYCYAAMFRYNKSGKFNVPYGGLTYNRKQFDKKIEHLKHGKVTELLDKTEIYCADFMDFLDKTDPKEDDFMFLDPPYDTEFRSYDNNEFSRKDHIRLSKYLIKKCRAKFMLIIKDTEFIRELYPNAKKTANGERLYISCFDKKYIHSYQDRKQKGTQHLLITNYQPKTWVQQTLDLS